MDAFSDLPTVTRRSQPTIELTEVVAFSPSAFIWCKAIQARHRGGVVVPCTEHIAIDNDCWQCHRAGEKHDPCPDCV